MSIIKAGAPDAQYYIVEVESWSSDDRSREQVLFDEDGNTTDTSLFAIVKVSNGKAAIVDDGYETEAEAEAAWAEVLVHTV